MKSILFLMLLFGLSSCELKKQPRKFEFGLMTPFDVCKGTCERHGGIKDVHLKIITGTPTDLTVTCTCQGNIITEWTQRTN